jgi:hypothetical protein
LEQGSFEMGDVTLDIAFEFTTGSVRDPTLSVKGRGSTTLPCTDQVDVSADIALNTDLLKLDGAQATLTFACGSEPGPAFAAEGWTESLYFAAAGIEMKDIMIGFNATRNEDGELAYTGFLTATKPFFVEEDEETTEVTTADTSETEETYGAPGSGTPALGQGTKTTSTFNAEATTEEVSTTTTTTTTWEENMVKAPRPRTPAGNLAWSGTVNFDVSSATGLSLEIAGEAGGLLRTSTISNRATLKIILRSSPPRVCMSIE